LSYRTAVNYLASKTKVIELCNQFGGRVAVCPEWNGRIMTSSCGGLDSGSFGLINVQEIDAKEYSNSGGEDNLVIPSCPEEGSYSTDSVPPDPEVRMRRSIQITNSSDEKFSMNIIRTVILLETEDIIAVFGSSIEMVLQEADVSYVGFTTNNVLVNTENRRDENRHSKSGGTVSVCIKSMFNSGQDTIAVLPFREGSKEELGPSIITDYFGLAPHGRIRTLGNAALLRADGNFRCQAGVSRKRALPFTGSIDFREGILTLQTFNMMTGPYSGEVITVYNHGPTLPEKQPAAFFYEFDFFSPVKELASGKSITHQQHTLHINANNKVLAFLAEQILGVNYSGTFTTMLT